MHDATAGAAPSADATAIPPTDPLAGFAAVMTALPAGHWRRRALGLAQLGMLVAVASLPVSIAGMNVGLTAALVGALVARAPLHRCTGAWCYLAYVLWLGLWFACNGGGSKSLLAPLVLPFGLLLAQVTFHPALPGAARLRAWAVRALVLAIAASCLLALAQYTIGRGSAKPWRVDPAGQRFFNSTGFFSIQLTQGAMAAMVGVLLGGMAAGLLPWWRRTGQAAAALAVMICGARAALLAFAAAVAAMVAALGGRRRLLLAAGIGAVLLALALGLLALTQRQRFDDLLALRDGRWPIWRTSLAVIAEHPLMGTGGGAGFREAYRAAYPRVVPDAPSEFPDGAPHAHNTALAFAAELGIPFAVIWFALLAVAVLGLRGAPPEVWRAGLGLGVVALVFGQFERFDGESSRVLWTGLGILLALRHAAVTDALPPAQVRAHIRAEP